MLLVTLYFNQQMLNSEHDMINMQDKICKQMVKRFLCVFFCFLFFFS